MPLTVDTALNADARIAETGPSAPWDVDYLAKREHGNHLNSHSVKVVQSRRQTTREKTVAFPHIFAYHTD